MLRKERKLTVIWCVTGVDKSMAEEGIQGPKYV